MEYKSEADRSPEDCPEAPPEARWAPLVAVGLAILFCWYWFFAFYNRGPNLIGALPPTILLGFWLGAGTASVWIRWTVFAFAAPLFQFLLGGFGGQIYRSLAYSPVAAAVFTLAAAAAAWLGPWLLTGRAAIPSDRHFSLQGLFAAVTAGSLVIGFWWSVLLQFHWQGALPRQYLMEAIQFAPIGAVIGAAGWPRLARAKWLRRRAWFYLAIAAVVIPAASVVLCMLVFGVPNDDEAVAAVAIIPVAVLLLHSVDYVCRGFQIEWIQRIDDDLPDKRREGAIS